MIMSMYKKICITNRLLVCEKYNIKDCNSEEAFHKLLLQIIKVCESGADSIILREKDLDEVQYEALARKAIDICKRYNVLLVLHTFIEAAKRLNHFHIHLPYASFCQMASDETHHFETVGVSTHTVKEAEFAGCQGASYVTISPVYETQCKPGVKAKGLDFLEKASNNTTIPVYALGGINEARIKECISHGASGVCMMSEYMQY